MSVKRVTPGEAAKLLEQGWKYVDVRSVPEFEAGHPAGAFNVPLLHRGPGGMTANPRFQEVMTSRFDKGDKLVLGCRSGGRSLRAAGILQAAGFTDVVDMRGGWAGEVDGAGKVVVAGWQAEALPVSTTAEPGRSYADLEDSAPTE